MTEHSQTRSSEQPRPLVLRFPAAGRRVEQAYRELDIALYGTEEEKKVLGSPRALARPWDPPTCADPDLRAEVWQWLEAFVIWLNHEYVWDVAGMIPHCWPKHPHLVHELAVLADLRRRAGHALTADALEEWHRYAMPAFGERMRQRMKSHCEDKDHQAWPAHGRHTRHISVAAAQDRSSVFDRDLTTSTTMRAPAQPDVGAPRLKLIDGLKIDIDTGEVDD